MRERTTLKQKWHTIRQESDQARTKVESHVRAKDKVESSEFGAAQSEFLLRITPLLRFSDAKHNSKYAWKAILYVAKRAICDADGRHTNIQGSEKENDLFHGKIDSLMLRSCKLQAKDDLTELKIRLEELNGLRYRAKRRDEHLDYRYKRTEKYLSGLTVRPKRDLYRVRSKTYWRLSLLTFFRTPYSPRKVIRLTIPDVPMIRRFR